MIVAVGLRRFYGFVAEGLLIAFGTAVPKHVALCTDPNQVPLLDVRALALAVGARLSGSVDVPELNLTAICAGLRPPSPCVLDAEGRDLSIAISESTKLSVDVCVFFNFVDDGADIPHLEFTPATAADVISPAIQDLFHACGKEQDSLVMVRYELNGFVSFQDNYDLFDQPQTPSLKDPIATQRLCARLGSAWRYADQPVSAAHILEWLGQFDSAGFGEEARQLLIYLYQYGYITEYKIAAGLIREYKKLAAELGSEPIAVTLQAPGKSESKFAYRLKPVIRLHTVEKALSVAQGKNANFVCFDDCIGSGETIVNSLFEKEHNPHAPDLAALFAAKKARLFVLAYHSAPNGVTRIENDQRGSNALLVRTVSILDETHKVFSPSSKIIRDPGRRAAFRAFCEARGKQLSPSSPLGWGDCQWAVAYDYSVPDNSLPIIYASAAGADSWKALFPRQR